MKKFVVIYYADNSVMEMMQKSTPEQMKEEMGKWQTWSEKCGEGLIDIGTPLANGQHMTTSGSSTSDKGVMGYSILQAENMDAAKKMMEGHPHLGFGVGCDIEVHESLPTPSM